MRGTVTISRLYGAGGIRVAEELARELGWKKVDRELVELAARHVGFGTELADAFDERVPALVEEAGLALAAAELPMGFAPPRLDDRALADAVREVIGSLADSGGYVILGRGGQAVLREREDAVHLQLVGDLEDRVARVAASQGVHPRDARDMCRRADEGRAAYVRRFHGVTITDPLLYDAVLNTSRLGLEGAAAAALRIVRARLGDS